MLFDHGCDVYSCVLLSIVLAKGFQLGSTWYSFFFQMCVSGAFILIILEEYYKGTFKLGPINGVSEGSILIFALLIFTACVGSEFWVNKVTIFDEEYTYSVVFFTLQAFGQIISMFIR